MISIARKNLNLSSLFSNPSSSLRSSNANVFPSIIHLLSTSSIKRRLRTPELFDVLVNEHQFSRESAWLAASRFPKSQSPERADSVVSFLKENSFTTAHLQKMVIAYPRILSFTLENLNFKFKLFQDLGLSPEDIVNMVHSSSSILRSSLSNRIVPNLSILKGLLGSNEEVVRYLRKSHWLLTSCLQKTLMPNVQILWSCGIPTDLVLRCLYTDSGFMLINPDVMRKSVDKAIQFGFSPTSSNIFSAAIVFSYTSEAMWEVRLQTLRDLGFSDHETFTMFRTEPLAFVAFPERMKEVIQLVLATGKYNTSSIVSYPSSLDCSIETRVKPRLHILKGLESRKLIQKWPALSTLLHITDDEFFDRFIKPY